MVDAALVVAVRVVMGIADALELLHAAGHHHHSFRVLDMAYLDLDTIEDLGLGLMQKGVLSGSLEEDILADGSRILAGVAVVVVAAAALGVAAAATAVVAVVESSMPHVAAAGEIPEEAEQQQLLLFVVLATLLLPP